jgi:hypothetical protein
MSRFSSSQDHIARLRRVRDEFAAFSDNAAITFATPFDGNLRLSLRVRNRLRLE